MRRLTVLLGLALATLGLSGCAALGLGGGDSSATPAPTSAPGPVSGAGWLVEATGSATPSPVPSFSGSRSPALPPVPFLPLDPNACPATGYTIEPVEIPLTVTPGAGSLTVSWPRQYKSDYRIVAIPQPLVSGSQPAYTWQSIPAAEGCMVTATISGLTKGKPYVVWLDAPNSGYYRDGSRHPYSGKSGVVYPN